MAYSPSNSRSSTPLSPSDDGHSSAVSNNRTEPYYSNHDIEILHAIVSTAQEDINTAREPKPLPVAALFKAYDRILPNHGLDPDEDQHLSTFVFRIGGENGSGSLVDKFAAILGRMGIELEFGDGEHPPVSVRSSQSPSPPDNSLPPRQHEFYPRQRSQDTVDGDQESSSMSHSPAVATNGLEPIDEKETGRQQRPPDTDRTSNPNYTLNNHQETASPSRPQVVPRNDDHSTNDEDKYKDENCDDHFPPLHPGLQDALNSARRSALSSVMNRWRNTAVQNQVNQSNAALASSINRQTPATKLTLQTPANRMPFSLVSPISEESTQFETPASYVPSFSPIPEESPQRQTQTIPWAIVKSSAYPSSLRPATRGHNSSTPVPRSSLLSVMDRWRNAAAHRQGQNNQRPQTSQPPSIQDEQSHNDSLRSTQISGPNKQPQRSNCDQTSQSLHPQSGQGQKQDIRSLLESIPKDRQKGKGREYVLPLSSTSIAASGSEMLAEVINRAPAVSTQSKKLSSKAASPADLTVKTSAPSRRPTSELLTLPQTEEEKAALQVRYERLLARAVRARKIYVASKVFNHWADKTARRLEREAVARRHMIRFRCFRGWVQNQTARLPAANHLRKGTALQKLKRAIAEHDEQLRLAASAVSEAYRIKMVHQILEKWTSLITVQKAQQQAAIQNRRKAMTLWMFRANDDDELGEAVINHQRRVARGNALAIWHWQAEKGATRDAAAKNIGNIHSSHVHSREWWNQSEIQRKAETYKHCLLKEETSFAFDIWNLQARAQAFIWRREYVSVSRVFDLWVKRVQEDTQRQREAQQLFEKRAKANVLDQLSHVERDRSILERLQSRARLFIAATRTISVFENAARKRKARQWYEVKRYLAKRYQEVSVARKQKTFFWALDRWRTAAARVQFQAQIAEESSRVQNTRRQVSALEHWADQAVDGQERYNAACMFRAQGWLDIWIDASRDHEQQEAEAQGMWRSGKQRQYRKVWTISAIQQSGLAHTAAVVGQRYERDQRNKAFQHWRGACDKGKNVVLEPEPQPASRLLSTSNFRGTWRPLTAKNPQSRRYGDSQLFQSGAVETPTRWTGQPLAMGSIFSTRPMPPVRETMEERSPTPDHSDDGDAIMSPSPQQPRRDFSRNLPSTTPRAPVPAHLSQDFRPGLSQRRRIDRTASAPPASLRQNEPRQKLVHPSVAALSGGQRGIERSSVSFSKSRTLSRPAATRSVMVDMARPLPATPQPIGPAAKSRSVRVQPSRKRYIISRPVESQASAAEKRESEGSNPIKPNMGGVYVRRGPINDPN